MAKDVQDKFRHRDRARRSGELNDWRRRVRWLIARGRRRRCRKRRVLLQTPRTAATRNRRRGGAALSCADYGRTDGVASSWTASPRRLLGSFLLT